MSQNLKFNLLDRPKPTHDPSYKTMIILYKKTNQNRLGCQISINQTKHTNKNIFVFKNIQFYKKIQKWNSSKPKKKLNSWLKSYEQDSSIKKIKNKNISY
jgi:hypothetical protein